MKSYEKFSEEVRQLIHRSVVGEDFPNKRLSFIKDREEKVTRIFIDGEFTKDQLMMILGGFDR